MISFIVFSIFEIITGIQVTRNTKLPSILLLLMEKYFNERFFLLVFAIKNDYKWFCTCSLVKNVNCFKCIICICGSKVLQ